MPCCVPVAYDSDGMTLPFAFLVRSLVFRRHSPGNPLVPPRNVEHAQPMYVVPGIELPVRIIPATVL